MSDSMDLLALLNPFGILFAALLAAPHILYRKRALKKSDCDNLGMFYLDRMGRFGSLLLMSVHMGVLEKGFTEPKALTEQFWIISTSALIVVYLALWALFFRSEKRWLATLIAVFGSSAVILSGILQVNTLLLTFGVVCLIGELYIIKCKF